MLAPLGFKETETTATQAIKIANSNDDNGDDYNDDEDDDNNNNNGIDLYR